MTTAQRAYCIFRLLYLLFIRSRFFLDYMDIFAKGFLPIFFLINVYQPPIKTNIVGNWANYYVFTMYLEY